MKKPIILTALLYSTALAWEPADAPNRNDQRLVASVIIGEAGGESRRGREAVYEVIWQRVSQAESNYRSVILKGKQFSCLNGVSPNRLILKSIKHQHFREVMRMIKLPPLTVHTVPSGMKQINRNRSDHYFAHKKVKPSWSNGRGKVIGGHTFEKHN